MAHNADLSSLVDRLVKNLIKNLSKADVEQCKRSALRTLTNSHSLRTNQFEITARLEGLEEKWRILNNEPLAETLHLRRAELSAKPNRWIPEMLSLLLKLSDRPIDHPNLVDLVLPMLELPPAPLTWADIVADDPLDDRDGIWKCVNFTADNSDDDERTESLRSDDAVPTIESSVTEPTTEDRIETLIEPPTIVSLREFENAQFWNMQEADELDLIRKEVGDCNSKMHLTELQAGREVLFLLLGLPSSIFSQKSEGQIIVSKADFLEHASQESLTGLLQGFAAIAEKLLSIRRWVAKDERIPLEQTFQAALVSRLEIVDHALSAIQSRILSRDAQWVPSLLKLYDETSNISRLLLQVHDILRELDANPKLERPFRILEYLYERTCVNQAIGNAEGYEYMASLFFECWQTYLKPIRMWMENGQLTGRDRVIFIQEHDKDVHLNFVWQDQYQLIKDSNGGLHAPKFLHVAAKKIFDTGKSVDFLRRLGWEDHDFRRDPAREVAMTYESVCLSENHSLFHPFAELFDMALERWIANKYQASLLELRVQIESRCGLRSSLDALEYIYFAAGAVSSNVSDRIFEKIDRANHPWNDSFMMTELFRGVFSSIPTDRLEICLRPVTHQQSRGARRSMNVLENFRVSYKLPWPVANVIRTDSISLYQRVFVFLMQLQRAKYLLQRHKLAKSLHATDKKPLSQFYTLRHRLLWLANTMLSYVTDMVLSVATADMRIAMDRAEDVDHMIAVHHTYVTKLEDQCLLLKKHAPIRQAIISLLDLTIILSDVQASYTTRQISSDSESKVTDKKAHSKQENEAKAELNDEDSDSDSEDSRRRSVLQAELPDVHKLKQMLESFRTLHSFVTAAVKGISKADSALSWEMLANNLAMGIEK